MTTVAPKSFRSKAFRLLVLALLCANVGPAWSQAYPSRPIRIVVPAAPATPPDILSRLIAAELSQSEGWNVFVENRPGAAQTIGGTEVLRSPADGYTLWAFGMPGATAPALIKNVPYDLLNDFKPVLRLSASYNVLVVHPSVPAKSVSELVALLKSKPDKMSFSSGGLGTPAHLVGELFRQETGTKAVHVPYPQFPRAIADLVSGVNQYMFITTLPVVDLIATGKLRALAVTAPHRLQALKDVPTVIEAGFPNLVTPDWHGFMVRSGTPPELVIRLNQAVNKALNTDGMRRGFAKIGAEPIGGSPEEFGKLVRSQIEHWGKVIKAAGMQ
jgi:tripartite-type tricarboxylate transporter receptor subunit TctC